MSSTICSLPAHRSHHFYCGFIKRSILDNEKSWWVNLKNVLIVLLETEEAEEAS